VRLILDRVAITIRGRRINDRYKVMKGAQADRVTHLRTECATLAVSNNNRQDSRELDFKTYPNRALTETHFIRQDGPRVRQWI